jgi:RimJ/RimL family protein N-acetyltransferase
MPTNDQTSDFYSHQTDLYHPTTPRLRMVSKRMPSLELRSPKSSDAEALLRILTDQRNVQFDSSVDGLGDPAAIDGMIKQWNTFTRPLNRANVVIVINGKTVGIGGFGWIGKKQDGTMIGAAGIMLDSEFRGQGYGLETLRITIDHGFQVLGLDQVQVACRDANAAMKALMNSKLGFPASATEGDRFGNDWIWKITPEEWSSSTNSK